MFTVLNKLLCTKIKIKNLLVLELSYHLSSYSLFSEAVFTKV